MVARGAIDRKPAPAQVSTEAFDKLYHSPLQRAAQTATIVWGQRAGPISVLPGLREIDLYSFQGLLKHEGKARFGPAFASWQRQAAEFEIDGQAPVRYVFGRGTFVGRGGYTQLGLVVRRAHHPHTVRHVYSQSLVAGVHHRELWYRASLAWQAILDTPDDCNSLLVVAHNAVNQALIATALGLPATYFRRLLQSNAAVSVLDLQPTLAVNPRVTVDRLNQVCVAMCVEHAFSHVRWCTTCSRCASVLHGTPPGRGTNNMLTTNPLHPQSPDRPFATDGAGRKAMARIVLVRHCATSGTDEGLMLGTVDEPLSTKGEVHAFKTAELLMDMRVRLCAGPVCFWGSFCVLRCFTVQHRRNAKVDVLVSSPLERASATATAIARLQELAGHPIPEVEILPQLSNVDVGPWAGTPLVQVRGLDFPAEAESLDEVWARTKDAWDYLISEAAPSAHDAGGGRSIVVVAHAYITAALVCHCLGLGQDAVSWFRKDPGGVTILDFPDGHEGQGVVRCVNYTAHLGRWAVPITREDLGARAFVFWVCRRPTCLRRRVWRGRLLLRKSATPAAACCDTEPPRQSTTRFSNHQHELPKHCSCIFGSASYMVVGLPACPCKPPSVFTIRTN